MTLSPSDSKRAVVLKELDSGAPSAWLWRPKVYERQQWKRTCDMKYVKSFFLSFFFLTVLLPHHPIPRPMPSNPDGGVWRVR